MGESLQTGAKPPAPPDLYGAFAAVDALGGVAAPLLAGFAITLMALVLQVAGSLRWPNAALVLLGLGGVLFLQVVQLNARARGYAVTPAQAREWYRDATDPSRDRIIQWELHHHRLCWTVLVSHGRFRYNLGILTVLAGIAVMLVPRTAAELTGARLAAIVTVGLGVALEGLELLAQRLGHRSVHGRLAAVARPAISVVVPWYPPVPPPPFSDGATTTD